MAIRVMHSFDYASTNVVTDLGMIDNNYHGSPANVRCSSVRARTGTQSLYVLGVDFYGQPYATFPLDTHATTVWIQHALWWNENPSSGNDWHIYFQEGGTDHVLIGWNTTDRRLQAWCPSGTYYSAQTEQLPLQAWFFIEAKVVLHNSAGSILVKINGVTKIDVSGVDTINGGSGYIDRIALAPQTYKTGYFFADDLMAGDGVGDNAAPPGDSRVEYLNPIGAGSLTQFTPLSGSNWGNVDETGNYNDADYNSSPNTGATDVFTMSNLSGNGLIHGVQTVLRTRKDDAGYRKIRPEFYKSNGVGNTPRLYGGLDVAVTDSFAYTRQIVETSPDTGVAWTVDEIADLQYGYSVGGGSQFGVDAWVAAF